MAKKFMLDRTEEIYPYKVITKVSHVKNIIKKGFEYIGEIESP